MSLKKRILRGVLAMTLATPTIATDDAFGSFASLPLRIQKPPPLAPRPPRSLYRPNGFDGTGIRPYPQDLHGLHDPHPAGPEISHHRNHIINAISKSFETQPAKWRIQVKLLYSNIPRLIFTNKGPLEFGNEFINGSKDPGKYFRKAKGKNNQVVNEWTKASAEPKVFIIGSGEDTGIIMDLIANLKKEGVKAYFYKACEPLCADALVGAFFITSDFVYIFDSRQGRNSGYIKVESKITEAMSNEQLPLIIDTEDVKKAGKRASLLSLLAPAVCSILDTVTDVFHLNGTPNGFCGSRLSVVALVRRPVRPYIK